MNSQHSAHNKEIHLDIIFDGVILNSSEFLFDLFGVLSDVKPLIQNLLHMAVFEVRQDEVIQLVENTLVLWCKVQLTKVQLNCVEIITEMISVNNLMP